MTENQKFALELVNESIRSNKISNYVSDGYHTFEELYEHRIINYIALCRFACDTHYVWRSQKHSDGSIWNGWFLLGINDEAGEQITYHLPTSKWSNCQFALDRDQAPEFDGHTSKDVLERINNLI